MHSSRSSQFNFDFGIWQLSGIYWSAISPPCSEWVAAVGRPYDIYNNGMAFEWLPVWTIYFHSLNFNSVAREITQRKKNSDRRISIFAIFFLSFDFICVGRARASLTSLPDLVADSFHTAIDRFIVIAYASILHKGSDMHEHWNSGEGIVVTLLWAVWWHVNNVG